MTAVGNSQRSRGASRHAGGLPASKRLRYERRMDGLYNSTGKLAMLSAQLLRA